MFSTDERNLDIRPDELLALGFSHNDIRVVTNLMQSGYPITRRTLNNAGIIDGFLINRLIYLGKVISGQHAILSIDDYQKHYKKLNPNVHLSLNNLPPSSVKGVTRMAIVAGMQAEFSVYNSINSDNKLVNVFPVKKSTVDSFELVSHKRPVIKHGARKGIDGVIEICDIDGSNVLLRVNPNHVREVCRYIIVVSFARPKEHYGAYRVVTVNGSNIYIYIKRVKGSHAFTSPTLSYRVYDSGYSFNNLNAKLDTLKNSVYGFLGGVAFETLSDELPIDRFERDIKEKADDDGVVY